VVLSSLRSAYDPDADATSATRAVLEQRLAILRHEAVVRTPSGEWFIALDALLRQ
jgi:hypothetical protein